MKSFLKNVKGYVAFITDPKPLTLFSTFLRIFVYMCVVIDYYRGCYYVGTIILITQLLSSYMWIANYRYKVLKKDSFVIRLIDKIVTKKCQKEFKAGMEKIREEYINDFRDTQNSFDEKMSLEEEIRLNKEFFNLLKEMASAVEIKIEELEEKKNKMGD